MLATPNKSSSSEISTASPSPEFVFPAGLEETWRKLSLSKTRQLVARDATVQQIYAFIEENELHESNCCTLQNGEIWIDVHFRNGIPETPIHSNAGKFFIEEFGLWTRGLPPLAPQVYLGSTLGVGVVHKDNVSHPDAALRWRLPNAISRVIPVEVSYEVNLQATHERMCHLLQNFPSVAAGIIVGIKYPIDSINGQFILNGGSYVFIFYRKPLPGEPVRAERVISFGNFIDCHDKARILGFVDAVEMEGNCYPTPIECNAGTADHPSFNHQIANELAFSLNGGAGTVLNGVLTLEEIQQQHRLSFGLFLLQQELVEAIVLMNENRTVPPNIAPNW